MFAFSVKLSYHRISGFNLNYLVLFFYLQIVGHILQLYKCAKIIISFILNCLAINAKILYYYLKLTANPFFS
jgi:hypothetical protein